MRRKLEGHDISGIEVYLNVRILETVHKLSHIRRTHQIRIEENVLKLIWRVRRLVARRSDCDLQSRLRGFSNKVLSYGFQGEAFTVMLNVHQTGLGVAGIYTHDVAETKLKATRNLAEQHEFPLLVTMEPEAVTN